MELLYILFCQGLAQGVEYKVKAAEMVHRFNNVIDVHGFLRTGDAYAYRIGLIDISRLIVGKAAALDMVGIESHIDLELIIDTALMPDVFFRKKSLLQIHLLHHRISEHKLYSVFLIHLGSAGVIVDRDDICIGIGFLYAP